MLEKRGIAYDDGVGHAAFYGPKIDIQVRTLGGTEETLSTVQLDFAQPARLGLAYTAPSGQPAVPYCIHRAPFSTHERFVAFLVELYGGAFPTWLAPVQLRIVPVSDAHREYAEESCGGCGRSSCAPKSAPAGDTVARTSAWRGVKDSERGRRRQARAIERRRLAAQARRGAALGLSVDELERVLAARDRAPQPALALDARRGLDVRGAARRHRGGGSAPVCCAL